MMYHFPLNQRRGGIFLEDNVELNNDWHEQVSFSRMYFEASSNCRQFQTNRDPINWFYALETKISIILGLLDEDVASEVWKNRDDLKKILRVYSKHPSNHNKGRSLSALMVFEANIDREVNKIMPFLNLKKKSSIGGL